MRKILLTFIILLSFVAYSDTNSPKSILVINSYNEGYNWTNQLTKGILENQPADADLRIEYMDGKNYYAAEDLEAFHQYMVYKYKNITFDSILITDDLALNYILEYRDFYNNAPVFFAGINSADNYDFDKHDNLYGIIEKVSIEETIETVRSLKPSLRTIHVVVDSSPTGEATKTEILKVLDSHYTVIFYDDKTIEEIEFNLKSIDDKDTIVLLAFYVVDPRGISFDTHIMSERITNASSVPVFGLYNFSFGYGIVGGKLISGYEQGKRMMEILNEYYLGYYTENHIESSESNIHKYDYNRLRYFDLNVNKLPNNFVIVNQPESFFSEHKVVILYSLIIIMVLIIYILLLNYQVKFQTNKNVLFNKKLNESDKLASLGEMMYRISHELNTPLGNSITTASYISKINNDLIEEFNEGKLSKSHLLERLSNIEYSSELLITSLDQANDLMNAFRIFSEHNDNDVMTSFDLTYYLKNLIKTYYPLLNNHGHHIILTADETMIIAGQTKDYYKIFNHLIRNSIEHGFTSLENKEIHIDLKHVKKEIIISYNDNGIGVPEKELNNILKPLYGSRNKNSLGLGLSQVNEVVMKLHGNIKCHSQPNEGLTIKITIPEHMKKI